MKIHTLLTAFLMFFTVFSWSGQALAEDPIYTGILSSTAIKGYDTVSYFVGNGEPVKGSEEFKTEWRGADWLFSSQENLDMFKADPEKYAPQYGGYCAWAAAHGTLAKGDPLIYTFDDGKIYLNYDKKINEQWLPRKDELILAADKQYPDLVDLN